MKQTLFTQCRGSGSDLVLLHGWGLNSGVFEPLTDVLANHFRVTLIDLPGFGRNREVMPQPYSLHELSRMVAESLPNQSILLGWSLGGLVAQQIAIDFGAKLKKLVLVASSPKFSQDDEWFGIKPEVLRVFEQQLERDFSKTLDRFMAIQAMGSETAREDIKKIKGYVQDYPIPDEGALQAGLNLLSSVDLRDQLKSIKVPTHRLYGRLDSLVPHKAIEPIGALQPSCSSHVFAHASHAPFISHPQEFIEYLYSILD